MNFGIISRLVDCSVGFETSGACGRQTLSFLLLGSFLPVLPLLSTSLPQFASSYPPLPDTPSSFLPLPRVPQAGSRRPAQTLPRERGGPPRPGPRWVPGAATPEAGPGSPAPRPARPNLRRDPGRCGRVKRETGGALEVGFAVVTEADRDKRSGTSPQFIGHPSGGPSGGSVPYRALPGASGIERVSIRTGVARSLRRPRFRRPSGAVSGRRKSEIGSCPGLAGFQPATTCHRSTSPHQTGS